MAKRKVGSATVVRSEPTRVCLEGETITFIAGRGKRVPEDWTIGKEVETVVVANQDA